MTALTAPLYIGAEWLAQLCDFETAIEALEGSLAEQTQPAIRRPSYRLPGGELLVMPAWDSRFLGVKLSTVAPGNPARGLPRIQGVYALFDGADLSVRAFIDAAALTVLRTAALSAVATRRLAVPRAASLGLFGTGPQAYGHLEAMLAVRPVTRVVVVGRRRAAAARLAEHARGLGVDAVAGEPGDASAADLICTCTSSSGPVVVTARVPGHAHLNVVGSHRDSEREIESALVADAAVIVDSPGDAWTCGDLAIPLAEGVAGPEVVRGDLAQLLRGEVTVDAGRLTVFKSVGMALADLAVAEAVVLAAERADGLDEGAAVRRHRGEPERAPGSCGSGAQQPVPSRPPTGWPGKNRHRAR